MLMNYFYIIFFSFDIIFFDIIPIFPGLFSGPIFSKNSCII